MLQLAVVSPYPNMATIGRGVKCTDAGKCTTIDHTPLWGCNMSPCAQRTCKGACAEQRCECTCRSYATTVSQLKIVIFQEKPLLKVLKCYSFL
jgi:hypothetical protein